MSTDTGPEVTPAWTPLAEAGPATAAGESVSTRRVAVQVAAAALAVLLLVGILGVAVVRRIAEREAVNDASQLTDLLARTVVMPALEDALVDGDPAARARLDAVVRARIQGDLFVRVKLWSPEGTVLYADTPELIGENYPLGDDQRAVLSRPATVAEVSDLSRPENRLERGQGSLLEVYRPVWTPSGRPLLFETYTQYAAVTTRTGDLWRGFGGIIVSSLLLFVVLLMPLLWALLDRLKRARDQRELLLRHALDASEDERRRIAADLHDGVVQELVAASLVVSAAADRAAAGEQGPDAAARLRSAAAAVRSSVGGLRTLLVDIYPQNLTSAGLADALDALAEGLRSRGVEVTVEVDEAADRLTPELQRLVYRTARECLRNTAKHALARTGYVRVVVTGDRVVLETGDDGIGLDPEVTARAEREGHLGLRLLADLARDHGAALLLATAPGEGTRWRLEVNR